MILADKIIRLRKRNGWSQEELAEKLNVSRQAVSKWEGAQTVPDLERVLRMSELFGVTTDYLLKDDMEAEAYTQDDLPGSVRRVTMEEANRYLDWRMKASHFIGIATSLCIQSPITLILLAAASEVYSIPENVAVVIGLLYLLVTVAVAVAMYVFCGFKNGPYTFLDKEPFDSEYGVTGMVRQRQKEYRSTYIRTNIVATCLCVLSPAPLLAMSFQENGFVVAVGLALTMVLAALGATLFIFAGVRNASFCRLLREGEFSEAGKKKSKLQESIESIYWMAALAIYLGWSFLSGDWHITWVIWPLAGILSSVIPVICNLISNHDEK